MSTSSVSPASDRKSGKVVRVLGNYGFVASNENPEQDIYFKTSWFRGSPPLQEGEAITFEVRAFDDGREAAFNLSRCDERKDKVYRDARPRSRLPVTGHLFDWAYLSYLPNVLSELRGFALDERWEFKNTPRNPDHPLPILFSYLIHTFQRLVLERKILVNEQASLAAFNTGLVDPRYEIIYALFTPNDDPRAPWQLAGFCVAGEGADGQNLVRHFNPLPSPAHYFDNPADLLYDTRVGKPELDWKHVIIDRIDRYPKEFVEDHWPSGFSARDTSHMTEEQIKTYYVELGNAIQADNRIYRRIMNRVKDAVDLSIKRASWNFKTAVPQYYPRVQRLQLLLPVCLISDEHVDLALAVEKTPSGSYLGHTALPLDWAYKNARLICRPDSDWLAPQDIIEETEGEEDI